MNLRNLAILGVVILGLILALAVNNIRNLSLRGLFTASFFSAYVVPLVAVVIALVALPLKIYALLPGRMVPAKVRVFLDMLELEASGQLPGDGQGLLPAQLGQFLVDVAQPGQHPADPVEDTATLRGRLHVHQQRLPECPVSGRCRFRYRGVSGNT